MPKYVNKTGKIVYLNKDHKYLNPDETTETIHFYYLDGLELIDIKPYITPVKLSKKFELLPDSTLELDMQDGYKAVIGVINGDAYLYLNEKTEPDSGNCFLIPKNSSIELSNSLSTISKIILENPSNHQTITVLANIFTRDVEKI